MDLNLISNALIRSRSGITLLSLLLLAVSPAASQWNWKSPLPQGNTLIRTTFLDTSMGWAVGEYGTIIRTTTGGASWYSQEYGRSDNMLAIAMVSDTMGWSVGDNGVILYTTDAGDTWEEQTSGVDIGLNAVTFLDTQNGWAAGDHEAILHTTNGGTSWSLQHWSNSGTIGINSLTFFDLNTGWGVGSNQTVFHTTDGGASWSESTVGIVASSYLSVSFASATLGFIVGTSGVILRTSDGGTTWTQVASGVLGNLNDVEMQNTFVGWICGDAGVYLKTINGGLSWSMSIIGDGFNFNSLARVGAKVWMVGELGKIYHSTNSGQVWSPVDAGSRLSANWIDAPSDSVICAVGQTGLIMRSTNGGQSWVDQPSPAPAVSCYGTKFTDPLHGWAVGDDGLILRTTDGGSWQLQASPTGSTLLGITFSSPSDGWIAGGDFSSFTGFILHSTDAGGSWFIQNSTAPHILYGIAFASPSTGYAVGDLGLIMKTTNSGNSWTIQPSGVNKALYWCAFKDDAHGWAVGAAGTVLHTTNGGTTWVKQNAGTSAILFSVVTRGAADAIVVGDEGIVLRTTNYGNSWTQEYSRTPAGLYSIAQHGNSSYWIAGDYGTVLQDSEAVPTTGAITGMVFNDMNNNGIAEPEEPGLQGWKVNVTGTQSNSAVTGPGGTFVVTNLPFGAYTVSLVAQPGWTQTTPLAPPTYPVTLTSIDDLFTGNFGTHAPDALKYILSNGWNLISLPEEPTDARTTQLFPTSVSFAFSFAGTYQRRDSIHHPAGYWLKFPAQETVYVAGTPLHSDTLPVAQGWNLVGSIADTIPVASLVTDPPGLIISAMYSFHVSYQITSSVIPGEGYWLKFSQPGSLIYPPASSIKGTSTSGIPAAVEVKEYNRIHFSEYSGGASTLFFRNAISPSSAGIVRELPPVPPAGCFDARFGNGSDILEFGQGQSSTAKAPISVQALSYPLKVAWNVHPSPGVRYVLKENSSAGKIITVLTDSGSLLLREIPDAGLSMAAEYGVTAGETPRDFALYQNMPNPFNPATTIRFDLPARSHVRITVYNLLGQSVATLVDDVIEAGAHSAVWSPSGSSGIYFYRIDATNANGGDGHFQQVRKMIYIK